MSESYNTRTRWDFGGCVWIQTYRELRFQKKKKGKM